jgi:predicted molibdopterin-dependent oxidoreductase YjgC
MRIQEHPILEFKKGKRVTFIFDGKEIEGFEGEPIASALHAAGVKVLSHSRNYNRPRGFWCAIGNCSSCNMRVNGVPNVRTCVEPLKAGMVVERQHGCGEIGGELDG